jgi:hypothetical protein
MSENSVLERLFGLKREKLPGDVENLIICTSHVNRQSGYQGFNT